MARETFAGFGGVRLAADIIGYPEDPRVLILPGAGQTREQWRPMAEALAAAGRQVVSIDLRGHGDSEQPADGKHGLDAQIGDLHAVLAALSDRPVIVAAARSGWAATAALGEAGADLATGLVLVNPELPGGAEQAVMARLTEAAGRVAVPTLIVSGPGRDAAACGAMEALIETICGAEVANLDGGGQPVGDDRSDAFNAALVDFLERRVPRTAPEYRAGSDARTLRDALGCFATGVTVVTTRDRAGSPVGLTANSFTSVSLDPPLLLVCLARTITNLASFQSNNHFAVNVLHIGQQPISDRFAHREEDRFATTTWESWGTGAPIISHALASFECERHGLVDAGDHIILLGRVLRVRFEPRRDPLLYFRGKYRRLHFS